MLGWLKNRRDAVSLEHFSVALPFDLSDADFASDPYPSYAWLRTHAPVAELNGGGYLITRHADILAAFTNPKLGNAPSRFSTLAARNAEKYVAADLASHIPPFLDAPDHKLVRQMVSRAFFNVFKSLDSDLDLLAQQQIAGIAPGDDLVVGASQPFALIAMCKFCGVPIEPQKMKLLTQAFFHLFAPLRDPDVFARVNEALGEFRKVIADALNAGPPEGSLFAEMRAFQVQNEGITEAQIVDNCVLVFADGVENIEAAAASLMLVFEDANALDALDSGALRMEQAVREGLRLQPPAQLVPRVARETFEIGGVQIKKDMPVFLALASGNRDPAVFEAADRFDGARDLTNVITFGKGRHRCIGEPLGMAQLTALMRAILAARLRPSGGNISYQQRIGHRWPKELIVKKG